MPSLEWKHLIGKIIHENMSLIGDERVISLQRTKGLRLVRFCVVSWQDLREPPNRTMHGKKDWDGLKLLKITETWTELTASQWNSSGIFSQDSIRCSSVKKSKSFTVEIRRDTREFHRKDYIHVNVQRHLLWIKKTMKKNTSQMLLSFLYMQEDLEQVNGHLLVLVLKRSTVSMKVVHKENRTIWRKGWCWNSQKADIQFSVLQAHCPEVDSWAKAVENCRSTIVPIWKRLRLFFTWSFLQIRSV